ncbi:MAG: hypothetical protein Ct9H90mP9_3390 [Pseudomonadota bacterium]|nr:MAG: hypothetical protein Ct9H90mP9_3390 [Pseudomonadota bacterium]
MINPFFPPDHFFYRTGRRIQTSKGPFRLLILSDKDGNPDNPARGEVIGALTPPLELGTEAFEYLLDRPFRGYPKELVEARRKILRRISAEPLTSPQNSRTS